MSIRNIVLSIAAGAVGLGALMFSRDKDNKAAPRPGLPTWNRVTRLAEKQDHPLGLVVDGDFVYFVTGGFEKADNAVKRVPTVGGAVETLAQGDFVVSGYLSTDEGFVYWTNEWPGSVMRVAKTGGAPTTLSAGQPRPTFVVTDDSFVYYATYAKEPPGGIIARVPKQGGPPETLATAHPYISGLSVDKNDVYFTSTTGLWRQPKSGGPARRLTPETSSVTRLACDEQNLYFFVRGKDADKDYAVGRLAKSGGEIAMLTPPAEWSLYLALSETHLYFFQHGSGRGEYALQRVAKFGGSPETVDVGGVPSGHMALGGGNLYFTDLGTLYRLPK